MMMKYLREKFYLYWWLMVAVMISAGFGAVQKGQHQFSRPYTTSYYGWVTEKWTGDEKPYRDFRLSVDKMVKDGTNPATIAKKYQDGKQDRFHPFNVFRWAYPSYLAEKRKDFPERSQIMQDIRDCMQRSNEYAPPHNYEFDHLRFLAIMRGLPDSSLAPMGERLVQRDPQDYEVRRLWAMCMANAKYLHSKMMTDNIQILIKKFPKDASVQILQAGVYMGIAGEKKYQDSKTLDQAIAAYRNVQSLSKPGDKNYKAAEYYIAHMLTMKKWYAEHPGR